MLATSAMAVWISRMFGITDVSLATSSSSPCPSSFFLFVPVFGLPAIFRFFASSEGLSPLASLSFSHWNRWNAIFWSCATWCGKSRLNSWKPQSFGLLCRSPVSSFTSAPFTRVLVRFLVSERFVVAPDPDNSDVEEMADLFSTYDGGSPLAGSLCAICSLP